jgi:hypothetical protein
MSISKYLSVVIQDPVALAKAVLAEVPKQCVDYFKSKGIKPGNE